MLSYFPTSEMETHLGFKELFTYDTQLLNQEASQFQPLLDHSVGHNVKNGSSVGVFRITELFKQSMRESLTPK